MAGIFFLLYLVIGLAQFFAIWDAIEHYLDWGVLDFIIAMFVTYIPLVGSILGYLGATEVWRWEAWQALALFFWYVPVAIIAMFLDGARK